MKQLVEWLEQTNETRNREVKYHITNVVSATVTIGEVTYHGAMYTRQYNDDRSNDDTAIYLLCENLPPSYRKNPSTLTKERIHYQDQDGRIWYIAGYMVDDGPTEWYRGIHSNKTVEEVNAMFREYHPFGKHFQLELSRYHDNPPMMDIRVIRG